MNGGPPRIFDPVALSRARVRAERMAGDLFLVREAAEGVAARVSPVNRRLVEAVDIDHFSTAAPALSPLAESWSFATFDPSELLKSGRIGVDLVTSVLGLHSINDLPGALAQIRRILKPDGLFVAALFGGATLNELRHCLAAAELELLGGASPHVAPLGDVRDLGNLLQRSGFALPVSDVERTTILYRDFHALVRDLRLHAQSNTLIARSRRIVPRRVLARAIEYYCENYGEPDGRLRATFDIVYLVGFAPSETQPKPLRPGSGKVRLADALGKKEHSLGSRTEKPSSDS
jgi:SAM-dependent methyltransferase